jgi:hypothetical protein
VCSSDLGGNFQKQQQQQQFQQPPMNPFGQGMANSNNNPNMYQQWNPR